MNIVRLLLIVSTAVLLSACGGGGGGGSVSAAAQSTVIDNFNMTEGTADDKLGATYLQEFLTEKNASGTTVSDLYSRIDLSGLESAHSSGWTGKGETITVLDNEFSLESDHGRLVSDIARVVSPGASRNEYSLSTTLDNSAMKLATIASGVITISVGYTPAQMDGDPGLAAKVDSLVSSMEGADAVVTVAAQHSNWTNGVKDGVSGRGGFSSCPDVGTMTVANCNGWAIDGLDSSNVIYVGEINSSNEIPAWSNQAGSAHKNQFLVTSADKITTASDGEPDGNSFAAPRVAGASALVRHKFPNLTAAQTATVILHTADDLGEAGIDDVYGHGELNVGSALAPIGNLH